MTPVIYLDEARLYAVFEWTAKSRYPTGEAVSRLYRVRGWAQRYADRLNRQTTSVLYIVRTCWVKVGVA